MNQDPNGNREEDLMKQVTAAQKSIVDLETASDNSVNQAKSEAISNRLWEAKDQYVALIEAVNEQL